MKFKKIAVGLLALSLLAIAFVSTAAAAVYDAYMGVNKQGNDLTFTILRSNPLNGNFPFDSVDLNRITLEISPRGGTTPVLYQVPPNLVWRGPSGITFTLDRRDLPVNHAYESWATGYVVIGGIDYTFQAAGPGWGWANIHQ